MQASELMDSRTYPVVYTMLGLQLLVLAAVLVKDKLILRLSFFSRFQLTPDSAMFTVTAFSALYEILMCILHFHAAVLAKIKSDFSTFR